MQARHSISARKDSPSTVSASSTHVYIHDMLGRFMLPTIAICVGLFLSVAAFVLMLNINTQRVEQRFISNAKLHTSLLQDWSLMLLQELEAVQKLFLASEEVTQDEFNIIASPMVERNNFTSVYWIDAARDEVTLKLHAESDLPAEVMKVYQRVKLTQEPASTEAMRAENPGEQIGLLLPVTHKGKIQGVVVGILNIEFLKQKAFDWGEQSWKIEGHLFEAQPNWKMNHKEPDSQLFTQYLSNDYNFYYHGRITLLNKTWNIIFLPSQKLMHQSYGAGPWLVLVLGILLTSILGIFLFHLISRNTHIAKQVEERTHELEKTTSLLKLQTKDLLDAKDTAESANEAKSDFLANMSHEIRTPLNSMIGMTELALESSLTTQQRNYLSTVIQSAETLLQIINDILDFSKIESGNLTLEPIPFDLEQAVEEVAELFAAKAREKEEKLELLVKYMPGAPRTVLADVVRIKQIIGNLLNNAIKFTPKGYIMVRVENDDTRSAAPDEAFLKISVEDTGIGIPQDKLKHVFEKFSQADASTTRKYGGTGLGLAICKQLAALMDGEVGAESRIGQGSCFWFTLKVKRNHAAPSSYATSEHSVLKGLRLLVIDDIPVARELLKEQLSLAGMNVHSAADAESAMRVIEEAAKKNMPFDMVIVDYVLPGMSGDAFTRSLKSNPKFAGVPVIMATSLMENDSNDKFSHSGCDASYTKPVRPRQLLDLLAAVWSNKQKGQNRGMLTPHLLTIDSNKKTPEDEIRFAVGARILLVEDSRVNQQFAAEVLSKFGCIVTTADNGIDALKAVKAYPFNLIFMDCQMPEMDGFEASTHLSAMKQRGEIPDIPIIALTANAMKGDRERCLEAGMNDYVSKPVRKKELKQILLKWLPPKDKRDQKAA